MADAPRVRAALVGATGRMGRAIATLAATSGELQIVAALGSPASSHAGCDLGERVSGKRSQVTIGTDAERALADAQVVLDFSHPDRSESLVSICRSARRALLVGTTGLTARTRALCEEAAADIPLLVAPNTSIGANVLMHLAHIAASALQAEFDVEIGETHHRHKRDAPSGTALALGDVIAKARGTTLDASRATSRTGGEARKRGEIGFAVKRGGDVVGDHEASFLGDGESLHLVHRAHDRTVFARGAIRAAVWLARQPPGLYRMGDVLGLAQPR